MRPITLPSTFPSTNRTKTWLFGLFALLWVSLLSNGVGLAQNHTHDDSTLATLAQQLNEPVFESTAVQAVALSDLHTKGAWSPVTTWPFVFASAANLPDGRIMAWGGNQRTSFSGGQFTYTGIWDPTTNQITEQGYDQHSMFCAIPTMRENGEVFVVGGDGPTRDRTSTFNYRTNTWQHIDTANTGRWYNGSLQLPNGQVFMALGTPGSRYPELWTEGVGWQWLTGIDLQAPILDYTANYDRPNWFPMLTVAPSGDILHVGPTPQMHYINPQGNGSIQEAGAGITGWDANNQAGTMIMYNKGEILTLGGDPNQRTATIVNMNVSPPQLVATTDMHQPRSFANAVMLPNGEVFAVGGNTSGVRFSDSGTILTPEIWNPQTQLWREVADHAVPRNYHSVALLMPDGRVFSGGGGLCGCSADHPDHQVYSPSYLFNTDGSFATRPTIASAPTVVTFGEIIDVQATPNIQKFSLIKMSGTTHSHNTDLRFLNIPFIESAGHYQLTLDSSANVLTPGFWMLFAVDGQNVPSLARIIQVVSAPPTPGTHQYVRFVADSEINGNPWTSMAELNVLDGNGTPLSQVGWSVVSFDSEETVGEDGRAVNAIDGNTTTIWHTDWFSNAGNENDPAHPHEIVVNLGENYNLGGFQYLPRPGGGNGTVVAYRFFISTDGVNWGSPVAQGAFANNPNEKTVLFTPPTGNQSPVVTNPSNQTNSEGDNINLSITASDADGDTLTYSATGLPAGLSINNTTGFISGMVTTAGTFNVTVSVNDGNGGTDSESMTWTVSDPNTMVVLFDFETAQEWITDPAGTDTATTGQWERANPEGTSSGGTQLQRDVTAGGQFSLVTAGVAGSSVGMNDIDNGDTTMRSPDIVLPANSQVTLNLSYYLAHLSNATNEDYLRVNIVGNTTTTVLEELGDGTVQPGNWATFTTDISSFAGQTIHLLIEAADAGSGSLIEAGIDDVEILVVPIGPSNQAPDGVINTPSSDQTIIVGDTVNFTGTGTDPDGNLALTHLWNFGAGSGVANAMVENPGSVVFSTAGVYTVTYTVTDSVGLADATPATVQVTVNVASPITITPITTTPQPSGQSITFAATASGGNGVLQYKWLFGDNTPETNYSPLATISHTFHNPGTYSVTVTAMDDSAQEGFQQSYQAIHDPFTVNRPISSMSVVYESRSGNDRVWNVNPDNDTVSVIDTVTHTNIAEIVVGNEPRSLAIAPDGRVWVVNHASATLNIIDQHSFSVVATVNLSSGSQPFGLLFDPTGTHGYLALQATGMLLQLNPTDGSQTGSVDVGSNPRHIAVNAEGNKVYVSRFITPRLPGEETAIPQIAGVGGEVVVVNTATMGVSNTIILAVNNASDFEVGARGVPNYLGAPVLSPDGLTAWVPSKQDNILRGPLRDGNNLNFEHTVRAVSSRLDLTTDSEDFPLRLDHDNAGLGSAGVFGFYGNYYFVALETSREIAVVNAYQHSELFRFDVGRAPQGLVMSPDGMTLYVHNFMDRSIGVYDLSELINHGVLTVNPVAIYATVANEVLSSQILNGKQLFYDARDTRLARDAYLSCAACHNGGEQDGRVWDLSGFGEGLRNTVSLNGRGGAEHGRLHWTSNFDEVQDFEGQIRTLASGTGLMTDADFNATSNPLGAQKAGFSADLDALAAYVESLTSFGISPNRAIIGELTPDGVAGQILFESSNCASCHSGPGYTDSPSNTLHDIGTITAHSGNRLSGPLNGLDTPTLRGLWKTAPYLHDGSAATLAEAVNAHTDVSLTATQLTQLVTFLGQIDDHQLGPPVVNTPPVVINPGNQTHTEGGGVNLPISANDANGDPVTYSATGLPPGVGMDSSTGIIIGMVTTVGTSTVTVTVNDGNGGSANTNFTWVVTPQSSNTIGETGNVTVDQASGNEWHTVTLNNSYQTPVVVMGPPSFNGADPSTVRVRNVTATSFQFQIDEWDYKAPGWHTTETIAYMVIETGTHTLDNGTKLVAGRISAVDENWRTQSYGSSFSETPVVLSQTATVNGGSAVVTRQRSISTSQFQVRLQEEENADGTHPNEQVHWVAFEQGGTASGVRIGRTGNAVTHSWSTINFGQNVGSSPVFLAAMQTFDGPDTASVRYRSLGASSVQVFIEEEQSLNSEIAHTTERVGFVVFDQAGDIL